MKKPKKLTIKPYLNDNLEAVSIGESEIIESSPRYSYFNANLNFTGQPLYYLLIYNRNNTKFRSKYGGYYESLEDVENCSPGLLNFELRLIEKIFNYKLKREKDNVQLKGFGLTYDNLGTDLSEYMNNSIMTSLEMICYKADKAKASLFNFRDRKNHFFIYYQAVQKVIPDIKDFFDNEFNIKVEVFANYLKAIDQIKKRKPERVPIFPIIDWFNEEHQAEIKKEFKKMKVADIELAVETINKVIWLYKALN
jgi:hypothetical protein